MNLSDNLRVFINISIVLGMIFLAIGFGYLAVEDKYGFIFFLIGLLIIIISQFSKEILWRLEEDKGKKVKVE